MRVLFLNHDPGLYGATRSLVDLVSGLKEFGVDSKVLSPAYGAVANLLEPKNIKHEAVGFQWSMARTPNPVSNRLRRLKCNLRILPALKRIARDWNPEIIYTNCSVLSVGWLLAKSIRRPHIWHLREMGNLDHGLCHDFGLTLFQLLLRTSNGLIANSNAVKNHVCPESIRHRVKVIHNGIASRVQFEQFFAARRRPISTKPNFLMVGAMIPGKGQAEAIQGLSFVRDRFPEVSLTILGGGEDACLNQCRALCEKLGLGQAVEIYDRMVDPLPFYAKASALLICSKAEAFGRVTAEAMAAGCPVIGRASGGTVELIQDGETGWLYSGGPEELAQCMLRVAYSPDRAVEVSKRAWVRAREQFCIENYAKAVHKLLVDVASSHKGG